MQAGIDIVHVPYKGSGSVMPDLLGGQVNSLFAAMPTVTGYIKEKRLRPIAVTTPKRFRGLPDVPTIAESGYPGYDFSSWFGILAPAGTPKPVIDRLQAEIVKALKDPTVQARLERLRDLRHRRRRSSARSSRTRSTRPRRSSKRPARRSIDEARLLFARCARAARSQSASPAAVAQGYPNKPVKIIVPFSPGTAADIAARVLGARLVGSVGAGRRHREPGGGGGQHRRRGRRQGGAGRLHAGHARHQSRDQPEPVQGHAVRHPARLQADRARRGRAARDRRESEVPAEHDPGADRGGEGAPGRDQLRLGRQRQRHASFVRAPEGAEPASR